ncbi:MAG: RsmB/NOP family class I SAM-dependent RNA methyltransferase [Hyphomicrobiaceae bacterium]
MAHEKKHAPKPTPAKRQRNESKGLGSRALALELLVNVLHKRQAFDEALADSYRSERFRDTDARDRGFARLMAATVLRRHGQLSAVIAPHLEKPLPASAGRAQLVLLLGAAQLCVLGAPPHAVLDTAVRLCRSHRTTHRFHRLANAVLRRVAEKGQTAIESLDEVKLNFPEWMLSRWVKNFGQEPAYGIARASLQEAALDVTVKSDAPTWAERLDGTVLDTGTVRCRSEGRVEGLDGYSQGHWWIQDAAAALPARLLRSVSGLRVADLCAAPGGKTAQLATASAIVTAVDSSAHRLERVQQNLDRLHLQAELVVADAASWSPEPGAGLFDAVLVDVPCTATGTIRRHPDILHLKQPDDLQKLAVLQSAILSNAANLLKPGGELVYCTCSLEPEECENRIADLLSQMPDLDRRPVLADEIHGHGEMITPAGDLRTLPLHLPNSDPRMAGIDGFYACRLVKRA